jgi:tetratricopeptide (TPR) repeat protein
MRPRLTRLFAASAFAALAACGTARADEDLYPPLPAPRADAPAKDAEPPRPKSKTAGEIREDVYTRLAASKDADETDGLVRLLLGSYWQSGSDTGDLLLRRAHTAIERKDYTAAGQILDAAVSLLPDWAEGWNARATLRYLDDDFDGSMADIAQTLKREPRHLGALAGMAMIFEAHDQYENALKVYERALAVAPHWRKAEDSAKRLRAKIAGMEL